MMNDEICECLIKDLESKGWKCNENTDKILGFVFYEDEEHEWFRDYSKERETYIQYNGRQKINVIVSK